MNRQVNGKTMKMDAKVINWHVVVVELRGKLGLARLNPKIWIQESRIHLINDTCIDYILQDYKIENNTK